MAEKNFNARFKQKHDTEANWAKATFAPLAGEFIVYDADENNSTPRIKIGDGETQINDLPFIDTGKMNYLGEVNELPSEANEGDMVKHYPIKDSIEIDQSTVFPIQIVSTGLDCFRDSSSPSFEGTPLINIINLIQKNNTNTIYFIYKNIEYKLVISDWGEQDSAGFYKINGILTPSYTDLFGGTINPPFFYIKDLENEVLSIYDGTKWISLNEKAIFPFNLGIGEQSIQSANSSAYGNYSVAIGSQTQAGGYAFDFDLTHEYTEEDIAARRYYLTSVEGIEVGLTYTIVLNNNYDFRGTIESIGDNYVTVPEGVYVSPVSEAPHANSYLLFPEKPTIGTKTVGTGTAAFGYQSKALGVASGAEGYNTIASGKYSHAEGRSTKAGYGAHAEGNGSFASGNGAHAEGYQTTANATGAHAEGQGTAATTNGAHAEGKDTEATGASAHAEGLNTHATGSHAHAEGSGTYATAYTSHAEGAETQSTGQGAHSEGYKTLAQGPYSHTEGAQTQALGAYSHTEGLGTLAKGNAQHVQGKYNAEDHGQTVDGTWSNKYAHIIGNGKSDTERSNAYTLDWEGNAWFAGNIETNKGLVSTEVDINNIKNYIGSISPVYQLIQTDSKNIYSGLRTSITAETITENGITFKRLTPVANNSTAMLLDCYNFTAPFKSGKTYIKMLMKTNQIVNPYFRALQATYSDGTSAQKNVYADTTSSGEGNWEEFIFSVEGTKDLDGQFKQCHIYFAGYSGTGTYFTDSTTGQLVSPTPYFDILGWAVFNSIEEAKAHSFDIDIINSQKSIIEYVQKDKADSSLSNISDEAFIAKARSLGFMTRDEITAYINEVILGGQW